MQVVHKQVILFQSHTPIKLSLPSGAKVLDYQVQNDKLCVWYMFNPKVQVHETHRICIVGTGQEFDLTGRHIKTVQMAGGALVWHIFEVWGE